MLLQFKKNFRLVASFTVKFLLNSNVEEMVNLKPSILLSEMLSLATDKKFELSV